VKGVSVSDQPCQNLSISRECSSLHVTYSTLALEEGGAQRKKILSLSLKENARVFNEKIFSSTPTPSQNEV
jgi:hypothetical protein